MLAYSDDAVWIVFVPLMTYSAANSIVLQVRVGSKSPTNQITEFVFQAAVPKVYQFVPIIYIHQIMEWENNFGL